MFPRYLCISFRSRINPDHFGNELRESKTFLTKDEHDIFVSQEEEDDQDLVEDESDYHKAYLNVMMDLQKQYNLRRRNVVANPPKKAPEGHASSSQHAKNLPRREVVQHNLQRKTFPKISPPKMKVLQKKAYLKKMTYKKKK